MLFTITGLRAQTVQDALNMSLRDYHTSARVLGTGSAMGAIGGDFGAININPANIGTFRSSYFTASLGIDNINTNSRWKGNDALDRENHTFLTVPNLGFITSGAGTGKWETINFGIGFNKVRNNKSFISTTSADNGSIVQRWAALANEAYNPENFDAFELTPAWESYALGQGIDENDDLFYFSDFGDNDILNKDVYREVKGGLNEVALSFGGNYDNKLMLGMNLGIPFYNNRINYIYKESDNDRDNLYEGITYEENSETSGIGVNFGLGVIYMPVYNVRIGLSFQSPTWLSLSDSYRSRVHFKYYDPNNEYIPEGTDTNVKSDPGSFDYRFSSPMRIGGQLGWIIGGLGFIDIDVEYVNYSSGKFGFRGYKNMERDLNHSVSNSLSSALSIRAGGELALDEFRVRLGVGMQQSAFANDNSFSPTLSGGLGFRGQSFYLDLAYRYSQYKDTFYPYITYGGDYQPTIVNTYNRNNFILTLGFDI